MTEVLLVPSGSSIIINYDPIWRKPDGIGEMSSGFQRHHKMMLFFCLEFALCPCLYVCFLSCFTVEKQTSRIRSIFPPKLTAGFNVSAQKVSWFI